MNQHVQVSKKAGKQGNKIVHLKADVDFTQWLHLSVNAFGSADIISNFWLFLTVSRLLLR